MNRDTLLEKLDIGEDCEFECKASQDKLPKDIWETVSAFANTNGGYIVLGITEKREHFEITGVNNLTQQKKDFWNIHNNSQKLSYPICQESDVDIIKVQEKQLIIIKVPQADRTQRPIYLNNNPLTGTFKRNNDGDYRCQEYEVKQMLRDANSEPQDYQIIENFTLDDLDYETIKAFRNRFSAREPDHPFLAMETLELMVNLGGWKSDRTTGKEGLTYAGLLMFGKELSITQALPHYHLDYQEKLSIDPEERWTYRITLDGRWQGNLFNFYYRVYDRLVRDLDLPFKLDEYSVREGETHVHQALREALSNCLIHADHYSTRPLKIVKLKDIFFFYNPGRLRIPITKFYQGGLTDPRNPHLQKMFQMVGLGDKAGSGVPKILRAWKEQQWVTPLISEDLEVDMTTLALPMISLIPEEVEKELRDIVRDDYCNLKELERIVLVLAHRLGKINNTDIQHYSETHPRDIGDCLKNLVDKGWLEKSGNTRGTNYSLPNFQPTVTHEDDTQNSDHLDSSSDHLNSSSDHLGLSSDHFYRLVNIAKLSREKKKLPSSQTKAIILELCQENYLTMEQLAKIIDRSIPTMRRLLKELVEEESLILKYSNKLTHPHQAYKKK